ncbi:MAG: hypothetical protein LBS96_03995 [Oscillospiraceae bacterium]|jgi:hypothetical protein|nr:hypothetical protein [Oscillospiraceae bacterium]
MRFPKPLFYLIQFTWALPQNLAGGVGYLALRGKYPQERFHQGFVTYVAKKGFGGVSLGCFIFMNPGRGAEATHDTRVHEFGHCVQSLLLGVLYWPVIAIPSFLWCNLPVCIRYRKEKGVSYYKLYTEGWANRWGTKWTKERFLTDEYYHV